MLTAKETYGLTIVLLILFFGGLGFAAGELVCLFLRDDSFPPACRH
jgi:hypothetical protein